MKVIYLLFGLTFSVLSFSQKLKDKTVEFNYLKAPLTPIATMLTQYDFVAEEENMDVKGVKTTLRVVSGTNAYDPRSNFYNGTEGLGHINGFDKVDFVKENESLINHIILKVGVIDVATKDVVQNGSLPGSITPIVCYKMTIKVPMDLSLSDQYGKAFYHRSSITDGENFTYKFPEDYKPTSQFKGYATATELETAYQTNRIALLLEFRNQIVKKWVYATKMDISSHFARQITDTRLDVFYIKEKKGGYEDVENLVMKMDTLFAQLDRQHLSGINTNWHTAYYKTGFLLLAADWDKLRNDDIEKSKSGQAVRFDKEALEGLYKNWLWCRFFGGDIDFVIATATAFESDRAANLTSQRIGMNNLLLIVNDYKIRYEANKTSLGWE